MIPNNSEVVQTSVIIQCEKRKDGGVCNGCFHNYPHSVFDSMYCSRGAYGTTEGKMIKKKILAWSVDEMEELQQLMSEYYLEPDDVIDLIKQYVRSR